MDKLILDKEFFKDCLLDMSTLAEEQRDYWTSLDSNIGDGDHGINLSIGFREISKQIDILYTQSSDISTLLKKSGMILLSKVGGASGPLYGSFFMKMGDDIKGKNEISYQEFVNMIINGIDAVQYRGKAKIGDKTMIDSLIPAKIVLENYDNDSEVEHFEYMISEMKKGSDTTIPMVAKKGRAMRLGERAIGYRDPGSESSWMLMEVFLKNLKKRSDNNG